MASVLNDCQNLGGVEDSGEGKGEKSQPDNLKPKEDKEEKADKEEKVDQDTPPELTPTSSSKEELAQITFDVNYKGQKYPLSLDPDVTVLQMKQQIQELTQVPMAMQKLIAPKVNLRDDTMELKDTGLKSGTKVMLVGATLAEVTKANVKPTAEQMAAEKAGRSAEAKQKLCERKEHRKILDKGVPDDALPGLLGVQEELPPGQCIKGMRNRQGSKLRLTFKLEEDQLWISTPERTQKVPMSQIQAVVSEPITGHEHYAILAFQLGPTEASRLYCYWVPAQYVAAIKRIVS